MENGLLDRIERKISILKWMTGTNIAVTLAVFGAVLNLLTH
jgi:hypothetical protein